MQIHRRTWGAVLLVLALAAATAFYFLRNADDTPPQASGDPWFVDVSDEVGLDFVHDAGPTGDYFMPQQVGSGAAFLDFDKDGRLDIYLLQNGGPKSASTNRLFRQLESGKLQDVSKNSGLDISGYNMGVAVGDFDNDGSPDVLVTQFNGVKLFRNQGDGTFRDVTVASGLSNPSWGTSAAFCDFDRDGWLDLVIVCYVDYDPTWPCTGPSGKRDYCAPKTFRGRVSRLFRNLGRGDTGVGFEDVTVKSGLGRVPGPGLGVLCADFDGDGWADIFVANDGEANRLWINRHDGTFTEEAVARGVAYNSAAVAMAGMGIAYGDVDGNGLGDLFVTHLGEETHTLWCQEPRGLFHDRTLLSGLLKSKWRGTGFGTLFADFDHDGHLDLAIVNGRVSANPQVPDWSLGPFWSYYGERNQLFRNEGGARFRDVSLENPAFCAKLNVARGLAQGDFDGDGAVDLLVTTIAGRARLYRNVAPGRGHWLTVRTVDPSRKRDALGAEVRIHAGERTWVRLFHPAESYLCSSEARAHFGLGDVSQLTRIEVAWPDGTREVFPGGRVNRHVVVSKGEGRRGE